MSITFMVGVYYWVRTVLSSGGYRRFYKSERALTRDPLSKAMLAVVERAYTDVYLARYLSGLTEQRIRVCVLMNWVRSISESLEDNAAPLLKINNWHESMKNADAAHLFMHPDFVAYRDYELAFIWGAVSCWLQYKPSPIFTPSLKAEIKRAACPKEYLLPYYTFCAEHMKDVIGEPPPAAARAAAHVMIIGQADTVNGVAGHIDQMAMGDDATLNHSYIHQEN